MKKQKFNLNQKPTAGFTRIVDFGIVPTKVGTGKSPMPKSPGSEFSARGFRRPAASRKSTTGSTAGFTLLELLVVITIMVLLLGVIIFNHQKFNSKLEITNLAYEVALAVREAQSYGLSVQGQGSGSPDFDRGYGVHFNLDEDNMSFILFAEDLPPPIGIGNNKFDGDFSECIGARTDNCMGKFQIGRGNFIKSLKYYKNDGSGPTLVADKANIVFYRPEPNAKICVERGSGCDPSADDVREIIICLESPEGDGNKVVVGSTGQIAIESSGDDCD